MRRWPYGFLDEFWGCYDDDGNLAPEITDDAELAGSLEYVLSVAKISDREREVLYRHYKNGETYSAIAQSMGLSNSRASELSRKGMWRIRTSTRNRAILSMGVAAYSRRMVELKQTTEFEEAVAERVKEARLADARYWAAKYGVEPESKAGPKKKTQPKKPKDIPLDELDLSVRTYNALRRSGHDKVSDVLAHKSREELLDIRCMGEGSLKEITRVLEAKGYDARHLIA